MRLLPCVTCLLVALPRIACGQGSGVEAAPVPPVGPGATVDAASDAPPDLDTGTIEETANPEAEDVRGTGATGGPADDDAENSGFPSQTTSQVFGASRRTAGWRAGVGLSVGRPFFLKELSDVVGSAPTFGFSVSSPLGVASDTTTYVLDVRARYTGLEKSWSPTRENVARALVGENAKATARFFDVDLLVAFECELTPSVTFVPAVGPAIQYRRLAIDADSPKLSGLNESGVVGGFHARTDVLVHTTLGTLRLWASPGVGFSAGASRKVSLADIGGGTVDLNAPRADATLAVGARF